MHLERNMSQFGFSGESFDRYCKIVCIHPTVKATLLSQELSELGDDFCATIPKLFYKVVDVIKTYHQLELDDIVTICIQVYNEDTRIRRGPVIRIVDAEEEEELATAVAVTGTVAATATNSPNMVAAEKTVAAAKKALITEEDIEMVLSQGCGSRAAAIAALRHNNGDIISAIIELQITPKNY
jgi:NACalpha-BTF3-like transcription factor